ncbi:L,D-transpeptidase family protein [Paraconexibacter sp.]|uniref:L,D-transpeptidase family protein n=1 Tax=Paraconexibacter sp. TaxID=2949640 RepID=UPI0035644881
MRSRPFIIVAAVLVVTLGLTAGVYAYDNGKRNRIAKGITVSGIDVGGMTAAQARSRLEADLQPRLESAIRVDHGRKTWKLGPREAEIAVDFAPVVDEALARSRKGSIFTRVARELTGGEVRAELEPEVGYSKAAVVRLLDRVRRSIDRPAKNAKLTFTGGGLSETEGQVGLAVRASELHKQIRAAIVSPTASRKLVARTEKVKPKVTRSKLARKNPVVLIADRSGFKLRLYRNLKLQKTYGIAVGAAGHETPAGLYEIANKAVNPAWTVPRKPWAGDLAGKVIPGGVPENPLKSRWLGIYDGVGIHGTSDRGSIGSNASHGCLRMLVEDVEDLYPRVPVGAPIYIA